MIQTAEANDPDVRELYDRTSEKRTFRVRSQTQKNPLKAVERRCPFGSEHPWDAAMRVQQIKITEALSPIVWRVQVNYMRASKAFCEFARPKASPWSTVWWDAWRLAAMLAWAGGCWLLAEMV